MTLTKDERRLRHQKQERIQVRHGSVPLSSLIEGVPVISDIPGKGIYLLTKVKNDTYYVKLTKGAPT